jgi:CBS-domain-containing membrane protein
MPDSSKFTDEDLREALKGLVSYFDVTEEDLKKIYSLALKHARQRFAAAAAVAVADAMTPKVVAVGKDDDIATAVWLLSETWIECPQLPAHAAQGQMRLDKR